MNKIIKVCIYLYNLTSRIAYITIYCHITINLYLININMYENESL